ncbi:MAG: hypothetical protein ACXWBM_10055, partial [Chthoniobacterales bacterium]
MDTPPPVPAPPSPQPPAQPQPVPVVPKPSGCGCFAGGCLGLIALAFIGLLVLVFGCWFLYAGFVKKLTADRPANVAMTMPSDAEYRAADAKLTELKTAMHSNQETSITLTATDLNALIARNPDFASSRNRMRIAIADSMATLELSLPLSSLPWPGFKNRWFNGSARLGFNYDENGFNFDPQWIEANGHQFTGAFVRSFSSSFSHSFTVSFEEQMKKDDTQGFWQRIKSITLEGDSLVITTNGPPGT